MALAAATGAKPTATPTPGDEPSATTASFADWTLRCQRAAVADAQVRICEVGTVIRAEGQPGPVAQVAIGRLGHNAPLRVTALVPANVSFPSTVRIDVGDKDPAPFDLAWRRCLSSACVAEAEVHDDTLARWRGTPDGGHLTFTDAAGRVLRVGLSTNGLTQALAALAKEQL